MATIIGELRPEATHGENLVLNQLGELSDDYMVWPELAVYDDNPDFVVLHPQLGITVLEVKDWVEITKANPDSVVVCPRDGQQRSETNPIKQSRGKAIAIANRLEVKSSLLNRSGPHQGKLKIPWGYAAIFPNLTRMMLDWSGPAIDPNHRICQDDLDKENFEYKISMLDRRFQCDLSPSDIQDIRSVLYPELVIPHPTGGDDLGVVDTRQEQIAKAGLHEQAAFDDDLTEEGKRVATDPVVRLVRGVAGSGKTLVLVMRAKYLAKLHPDWRILVITFVKPLADQLRQQIGDDYDNIEVTHFHHLCYEWLSAERLWPKGPINDQLGRIAHILKRDFADFKFDAPFLEQEFQWMKDCNILDKDRYLTEPRVGRGKRLGQSDRRLVYEVFEAYEQHLRDFSLFDWADVPLKVLKAMDGGYVDTAQYDAILVDESQDFAPTWFDVMRRSLKPKTRIMFMAADANQRIFRKYSWKSLGLHVVGRTRILPRSYRSTYEIMRSAFSIVSGDSNLQDAMQQEDEEVLQPELDTDWMRHGTWPVLRQCKDRYSEVQYVARQIKHLLAQGYAPSDIAVFHRKRHGPGTYQTHLRREGITISQMSKRSQPADDAVAISTMHRAKGLEYRAVFILQVQTLFNSDKPIPFEERRSFEADELRLLHVAMTRARDKLFVTYQSKLPANLEPLDEFLVEARRSNKSTID